MYDLIFKRRKKIRTWNISSCRDKPNNKRV